jgi:hypothetical protein
MSKSNSIEILAVLYLIAGLLTHNWFHWVLYGLAIENTIESMVWAVKERNGNTTKDGSDDGA